MKMKIEGPIYFFSSIWNIIDVVPIFINIGIYSLTLSGFVSDFSDTDQG